MAAAIAIKLGSRGPVIYRQRRVGMGGEAFDLYKLRTMELGADPVGVGTPVLAGDPRVTRAGHLLRRFSLDELPNLVNVLRGEMAMVGPRPTLAAQVELYTPHQRRRLEVKPGLTGWAQVNGRAGIPWEERIELDVWYVEHRSPARRFVSGSPVWAAFLSASQAGWPISASFFCAFSRSLKRPLPSCLISLSMWSASAACPGAPRRATARPASRADQRKRCRITPIS